MTITFGEDLPSMDRGHSLRMIYFILPNNFASLLHSSPTFHAMRSDRNVDRNADNQQRIAKNKGEREVVWEATRRTVEDVCEQPLPCPPFGIFTRYSTSQPAC